jgi:hypothetical protein
MSTRRTRCAASRVRFPPPAVSRYRAASRRTGCGFPPLPGSGAQLAQLPGTRFVGRLNGLLADPECIHLGLKPLAGRKQVLFGGQRLGTGPGPATFHRPVPPPGRRAAGRDPPLLRARRLPPYRRAWRSQDRRPAALPAIPRPRARPGSGNPSLPPGACAPLCQAGDEFVNGLAATGVERDLDPGVQPGFGSAQVAHQVDEPVQFVGLEGEDPLVVVE